MVQDRLLPKIPSTLATITREEGLMLYEDMVLGRNFEDKCAEMYYRGRMFGFVHLYNGQEAVSTGVIKAMRSDDYVCSTYRDHVHALSAGVPARQVMAELFGKETGCSKGRGGSMHLFSAEHNVLGGFAFVAEGIPVATGAAFQTRYRRSALGDASADQVTACFFGDGASNNGQFFECLNMASLWKLPILFVVENNKWAIGMAHDRASSETEIYQKASVFGMKGVEVDGMDVLAVRAVAQEAIARARAGEGPTLIEALTYRFRGHSLADPDELRSKDEKDEWLARDPIKRLQGYLIKQNLADQSELEGIDKKIQGVVDEAVDFADQSPEPPSNELYRFIWADDGTLIMQPRNPVPTVDIIIELWDRPQRPIVLIERRNEPLGWAIPGGFVDYGETVETAAIREAAEETGLQVTLLEQFHVYSDPKRDPRMHTLSLVFLGQATGEPIAADDAKGVGIFDLWQLPPTLCFDHRQILEDYRRYRWYGHRPA